MKAFSQKKSENIFETSFISSERRAKSIDRSGISFFHLYFHDIHFFAVIENQRIPDLQDFF